jgi:hypothetical protein
MKPRIIFFNGDLIDLQDPNIIGQQVDPQTGMPIAGMQAVPVFQGLKAKKFTLEKGKKHF